MKNLKAFAVLTDGNMKRLVVTYDEINDDGEIVKGNVKVNRIITDKSVLKEIADVEDYAQKFIDEAE